MDPIRNPFVPGAGALPHGPAGRHELLSRADMLFQRVRLGRASKGFIAVGLPGLIPALGRAAASRGTAIALIIDEIRYLPDSDMSALMMGLHRVMQETLPIVLVAAGLPHVVATRSTPPTWMRPRCGRCALWNSGFSRVRYDRLTPREKACRRAMADLGTGTHRSGGVARPLGARAQKLAPLRDGLIRKGMAHCSSNS